MDTNPKPFVFVLMPFSSEFTDIYEVGIKPACKDAGAYCERVDEQIFVENILERVYNQIAKADIIVAEMTGRNPNVFYETGYAHALNKRVVLLTQNAEDIPFDLKHYPHIVYEGKIATLKAQLETRIKWCVDNPQKPLTNVDIDLEIFANGVLLINNPEVEQVISSLASYQMRGGGMGNRTELNITVHNKTNKVINQELYSLALIMSVVFEIPEENYSSFSNERRLWNLLQRYKLFPDGWQSFSVQLLVRENIDSNASFNAILRLYTEVGPKDFQFTLILMQRRH